MVFVFTSWGVTRDRGHLCAVGFLQLRWDMHMHVAVVGVRGEGCPGSSPRLPLALPQSHHQPCTKVKDKFEKIGRWFPHMIAVWTTSTGVWLTHETPSWLCPLNAPLPVSAETLAPQFGVWLQKRTSSMIFLMHNFYKTPISPNF